MLKILLMGGTGAMGNHLKDILLEKGNEVYITSRSHHDDRGNLHYLQGNALDRNFICPVLESQPWDAIVDFMIYSTESFKTFSKTLLSSTKQYVFISSARVYSNHDSLITEETPRLLDISDDKDYLNTDEYALRKAREEDVINQSGFHNYTIIRPYITYSENRLQLGDLEHSSWLYRALSGRTIVFSKDVANHITTLTYGRDVAYGIAASIGNEKAYGHAFHITSPDSFKWRMVLEIYLDAIEKVTGNRPKVKMIARSLKLLDKKSQYQVKYDRLFDRQFDNTKILALTGDFQFTEVKEGLTKCISEYVKNWKETKPSYLEEAERDILTHEYIPFRNIDTFRNKVIYFVCRYLRMSDLLRKIAKSN